MTLNAVIPLSEKPSARPQIYICIYAVDDNILKTITDSLWGVMDARGLSLKCFLCHQNHQNSNRSSTAHCQSPVLISDDAKRYSYAKQRNGPHRAAHFIYCKRKGEDSHVWGRVRGLKRLRTLAALKVKYNQKPWKHFYTSLNSDSTNHGCVCYRIPRIAYTQIRL